MVHIWKHTFIVFGYDSYILRISQLKTKIVLITSFKTGKKHVLKKI